MAATPKFRKTDADVEEFLAAIPNEQRRADARALVELMAGITGEPPAVWGGNIVGFGERRYRYASGRGGVAPIAAFAPRKDKLVVYLVSGYQQRYHELLGRLGPHRTGKSCLYVKRLAEVDVDVLGRLVERSVDVARADDRAQT
jgi:hypothetical protein